MEVWLVSMSIPQEDRNFEVSLSGLPPAPEHDLLRAIPPAGAATDGWLAAFGAELAAVAQDPDGLEVLLDVARSGDRQAALAQDAGSRRAFTACGQIAGALLDRARVKRPPFAAGSEAGRMLLAIAESGGRTNEEIAKATGLSITQVSRTGARLVRDGWASSSRQGRMNAWSLTPNGARAAKELAVTPLPSDPGFLPEVAVLRAVATADTRLSVDQLVVATGLTRREAAAAVARLTRTQYLVPHAPSAEEGRDDGWVQLAVSDSPQRAVGITVQPGVILGVLTTMTAQWASDPRRMVVDTSDPEAVVHAVCGMTQDLLQDSALDKERVVGIGVNLPGHVDGDSGTVVFSPFLGEGRQWEHVRLAQRIRDRSGFEVVLENDVNALAVHAQAFGGARGLSDVAVVYIAPNGSVGAGLIAERRLVHGNSWAAGELGHIPIPGSGRRCRCGNVDCLETSTYVVTLSDRMQADGGKPIESFAEGASVAHAEEQSGVDGPATRAFRAAGRDFGVGLAAVVNMVNPEKLLLSGPMELTNVDAYASARAFDSGLAETFHAHGFGGLGDKGIVDRAYQSPYDAAIGAAATLLRRTVYATPAEVPRTATDAVPWLQSSSGQTSPEVNMPARMAAVGGS
jgi:predicted NBD/HSP70 family sugar kinase/DNA-binding MarR family transcriptional regulator